MRNKIDVRTVNRHGQISIGKELAGQQVQIERQDNGAFLIKRGQFIPENEKWLYRDNNLEKLMEAVEISENTPRRYDNFEEIMSKLEASINE